MPLEQSELMSARIAVPLGPGSTSDVPARSTSFLKALLVPPAALPAVCLTELSCDWGEGFSCSGIRRWDRPTVVQAAVAAETMSE